MRIAFSCDDNKGLNATMSHHFGRCAYYTFVDVENNEVKKVEVLENPFANQHEPGAVPQYIHQQNADVMISGGMGGRAMQFFNQFGVEPVTGGQGFVNAVLDQYLNGELKGAHGCAESEEHHHHD